MEERNEKIFYGFEASIKKYVWEWAAGLLFMAVFIFAGLCGGFSGTADVSGSERPCKERRLLRHQQRDRKN